MIPEPGLRERLMAALTAALGDSYDCTRQWSAWSYGTMDEDDFEPVTDRLDDIVDGLMAEIEKEKQA